MIFLLMCDGAVKCRFLFFLLEEDTILLNFMMALECNKELEDRNQ